MVCVRLSPEANVALVESVYCRTDWSVLATCNVAADGPLPPDGVVEGSSPTSNGLRPSPALLSKKRAVMLYVAFDAMMRASPVAATWLVAAEGYSAPVCANVAARPVVLTFEPARSDTRCSCCGTRPAA